MRLLYESMQSFPVINRITPFTFLLSRRMLSSNPKPTSASLYTTMNLNLNSSTKTTNLLPLLSNPQIPHINTKTLSPISNGFSSSSSSVSANPVSISGISESGDAEELQLVVVSFYKFADFPDHADLRKPLKDLCESLVNVRYLVR